MDRIVPAADSIGIETANHPRRKALAASGAATSPAIPINSRH
jgi:hypothetical protein